MEKKKVKFYKKWWFWVVVIIIILMLIGTISEEDNTTKISTNTIKQENNPEDKPEVILTSFKGMPQDLVESWFVTNNIDGKILEEYSDTVPKGEVISQSIEAHTAIHQGDKVTVKYSLGKKPTTGQRNALEKANTYSSIMNMSKQGIYKQLTSTVEGFTKEEAQYAVDNINADWSKNALEKAKTYQNTMKMSKNAIFFIDTISFMHDNRRFAKRGFYCFLCGKNELKQNHYRIVVL